VTADSEGVTEDSEISVTDLAELSERPVTMSESMVTMSEMGSRAGWLGVMRQHLDVVHQTKELPPWVSNETGVAQFPAHRRQGDTSCDVHR